MFDRKTLVLFVFAAILTSKFSARLAARGEDAAVLAASMPRAIALHVMHCTGTSKVGAEPQALVPGDVLRREELLRVEPGAKLRLVTPTGDRLRLTGPCLVRIDSPAGAPALKLYQRGGELDYVAAASGTLELETPRGTMRCVGGSVVVRQDGASTVECRVGPVHAGAREVLAGRVVEL